MVFHKNSLEFDLIGVLGVHQLISNLAKLNNVNPYNITFKNFGGSGYDIACSLAKGPIIYEKKIIFIMR